MGRRLFCPRDCPTSVYKVMNACWPGCLATDGACARFVRPSMNSIKGHCHPTKVKVAVAVKVKVVLEATNAAGLLAGRQQPHICRKIIWNWSAIEREQDCCYIGWLSVIVYYNGLHLFLKEWPHIDWRKSSARLFCNIWHLSFLGFNSFELRIPNWILKPCYVLFLQNSFHLRWRIILW